MLKQKLLFPSKFIEQIKSLLDKEWERFNYALNENPPISIRTNRYKQITTPNLAQVSWCENGFYLPNRPQFTFDPLLHAGNYYVQEASSMFLHQALKPHIKKNIRILDLCAAPGGKSTLIADLLNDDSLLVSNEIIRSRSNILFENITKWGNPNVIVTNSKIIDFSSLKHYFDIIIVDAPCSGEGMFRKDPDSIKEWSTNNVKLCSERQKNILSSIWNSLKPNGILVYSTCTYNLIENEENVKWIVDQLGAESLPITLSAEWGISSSFYNDIFAYRFFPHKTKGEGFFLSMLRKNDDDVSTIKIKKRVQNNRQAVIFEKYLTDSDNYTFIQKDKTHYAINKQIDADFEYLNQKLNLISGGICIGDIKGKDFIPNHSLALSIKLNQEAFNTYKIDWKTAISYLRKETIYINNCPKGFILLTYKNAPLGFIKNIGSRANNLYPQEWKIRSSHIPKNEISII